MEQKALLQLCKHAYCWVAYLQRVDEAAALAELLLHLDNTSEHHLSDKHRALLEAGLARWPRNHLTLPLCDALAVGVLLQCAVPLGPDVSMLALREFCPELQRYDKGHMYIVPRDEALIEMHSLLTTQSSQLGKLTEIIAKHDQHLLHLQRMQARLLKLSS
jgi:hypothetical protein